tara:strand:+ start:132 stop:1016 length:885 start_codon:yes stop_codon:yes gene_type:complete
MADEKTKWYPGKHWNAWKERREKERNEGKTPEELAQEEERRKEFGEKFDDWMKPKLSIDRLRYNFDSGARPNRYNVNFFCPNLGISLEGLRCSNATLPGRQLEAADWSAYGTTMKMPYMLSHDGGEVSFTFICDASFADRFIIDAWQSAIYSSGNWTDNDEDGVQQIMGQGGNSMHPMFAYQNEYVGKVEIEQYDMKGRESLKYTLFDAFPMSYAPTPLAWEQTDQLMQFECTFAFRTFTQSFSNNKSSTALNRGRRAIDSILDIANLRKGGNSANNTLQRFNDRLAKLDGLFG